MRADTPGPAPDLLRTAIRVPDQGRTSEPLRGFGQGSSRPLQGSYRPRALPWRAGFLFALFSAGVAAVPTGAFAQGPATWFFYFENDIFGSSDSWYTNGVRLSRTRPDPDRPWWLPSALLRRFFPSCSGPDAVEACFAWASGLALGQNMYTPADIRIEELQPDDRPYGGWLHLGFPFQAARVGGSGTPDQLHVLELDLGWTGAASLAEAAQKFVHKYVAPSSPDPKGWDNQIGFEPGILLTYEGKRRVGEGVAGERVRFFDVLPQWGMALGNIFTYAEAGAVARVGYNLSDDFGPGRIKSVVGARRRSVHAFEIYAFIGLDGRVVAQNVFLDGNTFRDSHSVNKEILVGDLDLGGVARYKRFTLTYRYVVRTREFDGGRSHTYGALRLGWTP